VSEKQATKMLPMSETSTKGVNCMSLQENKEGGSMQQSTPEQAKLMMASVFNRVAATYGQVGPGYFGYFGQRLVEQADLAPGMRVLDVGTGRGAVLFPAAQAVGPSGSVLGIDLSEEMVRATNAEIEQRGVLNARAQVMDADDLTFPEAEFDAITCAFSFFFLSDRDTVLSAFRRILRPGGRVALSIWAEETPTEVARWRWYDDLVKRFLPSSPEALTALQTAALAHARTMQAQGALITERNAVYVVAKK
jgi:ubiquinone/menaquinone biosynthesis C-methylase UbiE